MPFNEFKALCKEYWASKYGYLVIDMSRDVATAKEGDFSSSLKYRNWLYK